MRKAVFLDRDGVLVEDVDLLTRAEQLRLLPGVPSALNALRDAGFVLVVVSNQPVVARGLISEREVEAIHAELAKRLADAGNQRNFTLTPHPSSGHPSHEPALGSRRGNEADSIDSQGVPPPHVGGYGSRVQSANLGWGNSLPLGGGEGSGEGVESLIEHFYFCPHHPKGTLPAYRLDCDCRKPKPGLLLRAARELNLNLPGSFLVGDRITDIIAGAKAGCHTVLVQTGKHLEKPIETSEPLDTAISPDHICADLPTAVEWILKQ
jgi:HAD superfamily hydrolase (TIGR01662 family)